MTRVPENRSGYTMIEMTLTLVLVSTLLALGLGAALEAIPRWRLRAATADVAVALRAARARAVVDRTSVTLAFDTKRGLYTRTVKGASDAPVINRLPATVTFVRNSNGRAVTMASPSAPNEAAAVFTSAGILLSTSTPGEIYLGIPSEGLYRRVTVSYVGTTEVEEWTDQGWR